MVVQSTQLLEESEVFAANDATGLGGFGWRFPAL